MGTRSVAAAIGISLLSVGGAGYCYTRSQALHSEARWLLERGNAQAVEYAQRLDNSVADAQLKTFAARRSVMERAHLWQRGQMLGVMAAAISALVAYMLYLLRRLDSQLDDAAAEAPVEVSATSSNASSEPSSGLVPTPHR
jgi:ferric-dicitrate binding protein FerR (iron transport regulator)